MRILLDTHCLLGAAIGSLSGARVALLEDSKSELYFSTISLWEIAKLSELGRIACQPSLAGVLRQLTGHPSYLVLGLEPEILVKSTEISLRMHRDPADQIIVASALVYQCHLMTDDRLIQKTKLVQTL